MPEEANLARALLELQREGQTGVLEVRGDGVKANVYVKEGAPVYVDSGTLGDTLGRQMLRQGLLSAAEYARVLDAMIASEKKRFGDVLVDLGLMNAQEVSDGLAAQVRFKLVQCLGWDWVTWTFEPSVERVRAALPHHPASVEPLILAAMRIAEPWRKDEILLSARGKSPVLRGYADAMAQRFQLGVMGTKLLQRIDGTRRTETLIASYEQADAHAVLAALLLAGELTLLDKPRTSSLAPPASAPPPARPKRRVPLPRVPAAAAPPAATKRRARAVVRRLHAARVEPDVPSPVAVKPEGARATALAAEQSFHAGKSLLRRNRVAAALGHLRRAAELEPDVPEYAVYAAWANLRASADDADADARRDKLRAVASRGLHQVPSLAIAHYALAYLARLDGDVILADGKFRHAQRLDPETLNAERHVRIVLRARAKVPPPPPSAPKPPPLPKRAAKPPPPVRPAALAAAPPTPIAPPAPPPQLPHDSTPAPIPAFVPVEARSTPDAAPSAPRGVTTERAAAERQRPPAGAPRASASRGVTREWAIGLVLGAGAVAALLLARSAASPGARPRPDPPPPPALAAPPDPPPPADPPPALPSASAPPPVTDASTPSPSARPASTTAPSWLAPKPDASAPAAAPSAAGFGAIRLPETAKGHRVFVDGRVAGEGADPIRVACGAHAVKIGSGGKVHNVDVPCDGEVSLEE